MSRIRRYFVPALLLLPVIFVCGRLLLVPLRTSKSIKLQDNTILNIGVPYAIPDTQQTGWPWVYREQVDVAGLPPFDPEFEANYFSCCRLMADIAVAAAIVAAVAIMLVLHHRRHGVWFRFSIRELLAMIAIVAVGLSWWVSEKSHAQANSIYSSYFRTCNRALNTAGRIGYCTFAQKTICRHSIESHHCKCPKPITTSVPIPPINC